MRSYNHYLQGCIVLALAASFSPALAQEGRDTTGSTVSGAEPIEEIVVTGIRTSLRDAISIKRSHVGVVDAISADDFGKFPDGNLAESLARVPGIAIDRSNVEGQKVSVRGFGPEFNLVTLNGRQMPTAPGLWNGGRSFNFGDIAAPGVAAVEVYKSSDSSFPSGGIGATVNMITTKPLNVDGTTANVSLGLVEDSTSEAGGTPYEASLLFATNQERWGFSLSSSYQERTNREEGTRESNWLIPEEMAHREGYLRVDASNPAYTNNNTREDGYTFYQEPTSYQYKDLERIRTNAQATFQYAFSDAVVATVDYTYSNVDLEAEGMTFGSWLGGWDTIDAVINEHGAFTDVVVDNRSYDHSATWGESENENKSLGFNLEWILSESFAIEFDAHDSSAEIFGPELDNTVDFSTPGNTEDAIYKSALTHVNGGRSGIQSFSYAREYLPEDYLATTVRLNDAYRKNDMQQVQLNAEWTNAADGLLTSVKFGISHIESEFTDMRTSSTINVNPNVTPADYDDSLFRRTPLGNFMNGFDPTIGTDYYYRIDPREALEAFYTANPDPGSTGTESFETVKETLDSAFVQFNMETEVGRMPLNIVAGLRYEGSEVESTSRFAVAEAIRWDMVAGLIAVPNPDGPATLPSTNDDSLFLPSLAMSLGITEEQVVRLAIGRSMARPDLSQLSSRVSIGNLDFFNLTADFGNPELDPLVSDNLDLSYEYYYADGSYFAVNYFYKEIDNFIGRRTDFDQPMNDLTDPSLTAIGITARECVQEWVDAGRPDPGFPGEPGPLGNFCVSQQALWAQAWMNQQQHMGWVALGLANGVDVSEGYPWAHGYLCDVGYDGWWRCDPGYIDATSTDPIALFDMTAPYNMNSGTVSGFEIALQHLFGNSPFGIQLNFTKVSGGDVDIKRNVVGEQFVLPGFGDSGNFSVFYEDERHTARIAYNYRGETALGFANYLQPLYVAERNQIDLSYQFRFNEQLTFFLDAANINDETTRLFARHDEMLFLSQDHGPVYKFGLRASF